MKFDEVKIHEIIDELERIIEEVKEETLLKKRIWKNVHSAYVRSARNLIQYQKLRSFDTRSLQKKLERLGMSRLAKAESHVLASLFLARFVLSRLIGKETCNNPQLSIKKGQKLLDTHTRKLLGPSAKGRRVRIMVTLPAEAADDYHLVLSMVRDGMNCARINCAHDGPEVWEKMIGNVRKAADKLNKNIKIVMDLQGPKIRTGSLASGPKVRKFSPVRDNLGRVVRPAVIRLADRATRWESDTLVVDRSWREQLRAGDKIETQDTRGKKRMFSVVENSNGSICLSSSQTTYLSTGTLLVPDRPELESCPVGELPEVDQYILLSAGDRLTVCREQLLGKGATCDALGNRVENAIISCTHPEVFDRIKPGSIVYFDDGKIKSIVEEACSDYFIVTVTRAKEGGSKLRADKGINFPGTDLGIRGLTVKDREDLAFVAEHADIVSFSFVNDAEDVEGLKEELEKLNALDKLGVIFKIETQKAYNNLIKIILSGMSLGCIGVMIARGDLAIETGWKNMGRIQREILMISNAAHIPVVWATQVLESLAKKGLPSRAELTDVSFSLMAECVMLNKGIYINKTIKMLDEILREMEKFQEKRAEMLPRLEKIPLV